MEDNLDSNFNLPNILQNLSQRKAVLTNLNNLYKFSYLSSQLIFPAIQILLSILDESTNSTPK